LLKRRHNFGLALQLRDQDVGVQDHYSGAGDAAGSLPLLANMFLVFQWIHTLSAQNTGGGFPASRNSWLRLPNALSLPNLNWSGVSHRLYFRTNRQAPGTPDEDLKRLKLIR
jgi:hypothetical protein